MASKRKIGMQKGGGRAVIEYFHKMLLEDPSYLYSIEIDDDGLIMNMFWADARLIIDYRYIGDVVCFDTTNRTNECGRPCAPFIGVNYHKQTIIFGAAMLYDGNCKII